MEKELCGGRLALSVCLFIISLRGVLGFWFFLFVWGFLVVFLDMI